MTYDPIKHADRANLAIAVMAKLTACGFTPLRREGTKEAVYARDVDGTDGRIRVLVYTTVVPGPGGTFEVREIGSDSIKVCALYTTKRPGFKGKERGLVKDRRIHRSGQIKGKGGILDRMLDRMREVYKAAKTGECCPSCSAPMFITKAKKLCCSELCWKSDTDIAKPYRPPAQRRRSSYRRRW
jgi:hypothetical protein